MATTWPREPLRPFVPSNSFLSLLEVERLEAASQTFPVGAPLKLSSGLLAEWVSVADGDMYAISQTAGQNTTGATVKCVLLEPHVWLEGNFLGSAAAANTLAAGDLGLSCDLIKGTALLGAGEDGWYFSDTTAGVAVAIAAFECNQVRPNITQIRPAAGDIDARVQAIVLAGKSFFSS